MKGRVLLPVVAVALWGASGGQAFADRYVALGDSYASGTGTREYYDSSCQRSNYAYPKLIAAERANTTLVFAACSGAKTADVINNQLSSLTTGTNWVSITIGGNDAGFSSVITECAQPWWSSNCNAAIDQAQAFITNTLPGRLTNVFNGIKSRSPSAIVIAMSYPRLFMGEDCNAGTWFSPEEQTRLNTTANMLRDKIRDRALAAGANFRFKDAIPPFVGHAVCDSPEWVNGLSNPVGESYHPNRDGHRLGYKPLVRSVIG